MHSNIIYIAQITFALNQGKKNVNKKNTGFCKNTPNSHEIQTSIGPFDLKFSNLLVMKTAKSQNN